MTKRTKLRWSDYSKLRKESPREYRSMKVQENMMQDRAFYGESFYQSEKESDRLAKAVAVLEEFVTRDGDDS